MSPSNKRRASKKVNTAAFNQENTIHLLSELFLPICSSHPYMITFYLDTCLPITNLGGRVVEKMLIGCSRV